MQSTEIKINNKIVKCFFIDLPNAPLVVAIARKGYIMCGYLNLPTAEKFGDAACIVRGVKSIDDLLNGEIFDLTSKAKKLGIKKGLKSKNALKKLL